VELRKKYRDLSYEEKKARMKERARQWFIEHVENYESPVERRLNRLRRLTQSATKQGGAMAS